MRGYIIQSAIMIICLFSSLIFLGSLYPVSAQATRSIQMVGRRLEMLNRQAREYEREHSGDYKKRDAESAAKTRQIRAEIEEDLNALQTAYNTALLKLQNKQELPAAYFVETGTSIKKYAARLRSNLVLPEQEQTTAAPNSPLQLAATDRQKLQLLCLRIYGFITNPRFEAGSAFDVKLSARAAADLDSIILISEQLSGTGQ